MTTRAYLRSLKSVLLIGGAFASLPLLTSFAGLQPPWPPAIGPLSGAAVFLASLIVWEWTKHGHKQRRRSWIIASAICCSFGLVLYLFLYSRFIDNIPGSTARVIRGYECTASAKLVYGQSCPNLPADALQGAEWESTELWTRASVTNIRLALAIAWLLFTCGLIAAVGAVVAGDQQR